MGDVVCLVDGAVAELWFCFGIGDTLSAVVSKWPVQRSLSPTCSVVMVRDDPEIVPIALLVQSATYKKDSVTSLATVLAILAFALRFKQVHDLGEGCSDSRLF